MKAFALISLFLLGLPLGLDAAGCGDEGIPCGDEERCCEHVVAMFSGDAPATPPYVQGRCVPKAQKCREFWCGNRHCESGFFGRPDVCCVNTPPGALPQYTCAHSELSCPGNSQKLSIRDRDSERILQGS